MGGRFWILWRPMTEYARTAIRRLSIRGFRSIRSVDLDEIPDLVVLHGPNGAGKSNLLGAVQLILRAAVLPGDLPVGGGRARVLSLKDADTSLGLRPEDFHYPGLPEIRVAIDVAIGTKATEIVRAPPDHTLGPLSMEIVIQLPADDRITYWFERADVGGAAQLGQVTLPNPSGKNPFWERPEGELLSERIREVLLPRLLQVSPAYRVPGGTDDIEAELFRAHLSGDRYKREAVRRLGRRLASAGLFGAGPELVALLPVDDERYGERRILLTHPLHGDLPLRNLGSGEQQIVYMLAQRAITPSPIAHIEEPEAHLHASLMEPFARILHDSVAPASGTPDVDQLWIATHHHLFAIAPEFFDVSLDATGATQLETRPRDEAIKHFYEPHPYWETLRTLVEDKRLDEETILVEDDSGPIRAKDVLSSMNGDRLVANRYVAAATRALVLSLAQERLGK